MELFYQNLFECILKIGQLFLKGTNHLWTLNVSGREHIHETLYLKRIL